MRRTKKLATVLSAMACLMALSACPDEGDDGSEGKGPSEESSQEAKPDQQQGQKTDTSSPGPR